MEQPSAGGGAIKEEDRSLFCKRCGRDAKYIMVGKGEEILGHYCDRCAKSGTLGMAGEMDRFKRVDIGG
jgi:hypothetical protein